MALQLYVSGGGAGPVVPLPPRPPAQLILCGGVKNREGRDYRVLFHSNGSLPEGGATFELLNGIEGELSDAIDNVFVERCGLGGGIGRSRRPYGISSDDQRGDVLPSD